MRSIGIQCCLQIRPGCILDFHCVCNYYSQLSTRLVELSRVLCNLKILAMRIVKYSMICSFSIRFTNVFTKYFQVFCWLCILDHKKMYTKPIRWKLSFSHIRDFIQLTRRYYYHSQDKYSKASMFFLIITTQNVYLNKFNGKYSINSIWHNIEPILIKCSVKIFK